MYARIWLPCSSPSRSASRYASRAALVCPARMHALNQPSHTPASTSWRSTSHSHSSDNCACVAAPWGPSRPGAHAARNKSRPEVSRRLRPADEPPESMAWPRRGDSSSQLKKAVQAWPMRPAAARAAAAAVASRRRSALVCAASLRRGCVSSSYAALSRTMSMPPATTRVEPPRPTLSPHSSRSPA
eukprot:scaffold3690_cov113-Isochrysis_galbana.AAC.3